MFGWKILYDYDYDTFEWKIKLREQNGKRQGEGTSFLISVAWLLAIGEYYGIIKK